MATHSLDCLQGPVTFCESFKLEDMGTRKSFISITLLSILYVFVSVFPKFETKLMFAYVVPLCF